MSNISDEKLGIFLIILILAGFAFSSGFIIGKAKVSPYDCVRNVSKKVLNKTSKYSAGRVVRADNYDIKKIENGVFTIAVLPDTQLYSLSFPKFFENITRWIVSRENKWKIGFATHEGDLVQHHSSKSQWKNAQRSMRILDNSVPYGFCAGNHDMDKNHNAFEMRKYFPCEYYEKNGKSNYWGGCQGAKNNYQLFTTSEMNMLILHLEYFPSEQILNWAESVLENHPDRWSVITTHSYLNLNGGRTKAGKIIWENLVVPYPNVHLVLCGHIHGEAKSFDKVDNRTVGQLLADYQNRPNGGNGWIRLLTFHPQENKINIRTYSPYLNAFETDNNSQFSWHWK